MQKSWKNHGMTASSALWTSPCWHASGTGSIWQLDQRSCQVPSNESCCRIWKDSSNELGELTFVWIGISASKRSFFWWVRVFNSVNFCAFTDEHPQQVWFGNPNLSWEMHQWRLWETVGCNFYCWGHHFKLVSYDHLAILPCWHFCTINARFAVYPQRCDFEVGNLVSYPKPPGRRMEAFCKSHVMPNLVQPWISWILPRQSNMDPQNPRNVHTGKSHWKWMITRGDPYDLGHLPINQARPGLESTMAIYDPPPPWNLRDRPVWTDHGKYPCQPVPSGENCRI